jgi:hypothetical protein
MAMKGKKMAIDKLIKLLKEIEKTISAITNKTISLEVYEKLDVSVFPEEIENINLNDRNGIYIYTSLNGDQIYYIGISNNVVRRFYKHIGKKTAPGFSYKTRGRQAYFPDCELAHGRPWLNKETEDAMKNGRFQITFIIPNDKDIKGFLEELLIYYCKATENQSHINVIK